MVYKTYQHNDLNHKIQTLTMFMVDLVPSAPSSNTFSKVV